jgi:hypothetical protein
MRRGPKNPPKFQLKLRPQDPLVEKVGEDVQEWRKEKSKRRAEKRAEMLREQLPAAT